MACGCADPAGRSEARSRFGPVALDTMERRHQVDEWSEENDVSTASAASDRNGASIASSRNSHRAEWQRECSMLTIGPFDSRFDLSPTTGRPTGQASRCTRQICDHPPARAKWPGKPSGARIIVKNCKQQMVLPAAGDFQIAPRIALLGEAAALQQADGWLIHRQARSLDSVQPKLVEAASDHGGNSR